jgi:DNA helicase HerA-like ATPase
LINEKIGYIVGQAETGHFVFASDLESYPPKHEYLLVRDVKERKGDGFIRVDVLAQVNRISNKSDILSDTLSLEELEKIIGRFSGTTKVFGEAKVLGYMDDRGEVIMPRSATVPGQEVTIAPSEMLESFFTKSGGRGIHIGGLITREEVNVQLDPNGFRRHVAVIAQTGAGKSYLVGLILEKLLPLGASIIVLDPNSDYVMMKKTGDRGASSIAEDVVIYRPPGIKGRRYTDEDIGSAESYTIEFNRLQDTEIFEVAGINEKWVHLRGIITDSLKSMEGTYGPKQLMERLTWLSINDDDRQRREAAGRASNYIRRLTNYKVWGTKDIPLDDLTKPKHMSIIDLAGLQRNVTQYIVQKTLADVWQLAVTGGLQFPIFVVLEEAHNFAPGDQGGFSSGIIERIAAEGRKFGIFLLVITQRPNKINSNVLSQCNSQIIMRLTNPDDMSAVRRSSEGLSEDLFNDLPGLNKGEAVIVGDLTKIPTMVKISGRTTGEGGSDIDLDAALQRALEEYGRSKKMAPEKAEVKEPKSRW